MVKEYNKMVVIFIDLLGTKNNTGFNSKYGIHQLFHSEIKQNEERQTNISHVIYDRKIYSFSDCAYIFYFYKEGIEEERKDTDKLVQIALYNTSVSLLRIMNNGYLIRGGVTYGDAYFDDLGFFGPAVEEAYELESKKAKFPRIIFSDKIGKSVYEMERNVQSNELYKMLYNQVFYLCCKENDDYYLNPFYHLQETKVLQMDDGTQFTLEDVKQKLTYTIQRDLKKYRGNEVIEEKLKWMKEFMEGFKFTVNEDVVAGTFGMIPKTLSNKRYS